MEDVTKILAADRDKYEDDAEYILGYCVGELDRKLVKFNNTYHVLVLSSEIRHYFIFS